MYKCCCKNISFLSLPFKFCLEFGKIFVYQAFRKENIVWRYKHISMILYINNICLLICTLFFFGNDKI